MTSSHRTGVTTPVLSLLCLMLLASCGGGNDSAADSDKPGILAGALIDGYIEGAKVCLDLNGNGACDAGEPMDTTNSQGRYKIDAGSLKTDGLALIAQIPASAKDSDDGGKTLAQAGKAAYTMASLTEMRSVITPITTLVTDEVMNRKLSLTQAKAKVLADLGLPVTVNTQEDHVATNNVPMQEAAKQAARQLQLLQTALPSDTPASQVWAQVQQARRKAQGEAGSVSKIASAALNMPEVLSKQATGTLFAYNMTSAKGLPIKATAMLFLPKQAAPAGGWPLLVFGHGTVGVGNQCAPSVTMNNTGAWDYADLVAQLLSYNVAVVAPDYEGLGSAEMGVVPGHPYLDLRSAGQSMVLAAVAAKKMQGSKLSGVWAALGHSQGGHAALAAAQYAGMAQQLEPTLAYKGAVAVAPASNLQAALNVFGAFVNGATTPDKYDQGYGAVINTSVYAAYVLKGSESTPSPVAASTLLRSNMQDIYKSVADECLTEFSSRIQKDVGKFIMPTTQPAGYPGVNYAAVNTLGRRLAAIEPGQVQLPGKTLIVQGQSDTTVLPEITRVLKATLLKAGTDVTLSEFSEPDATHSGVLYVPRAKKAMTDFLLSLMAPSAE